MDPKGVKRRLAAILSADAVGFTRLMAEDEEATLGTLSAWREEIGVRIEAHRGRVVDAPGDNLLAEFASVVDAVRCALAVQERLRARNAALPAARRLLFRIGVHVGEVIVEGERLYGNGVNLAARLEGLAEPGGIALSRAAVEQVEGKLAISLEDLGERRVKNVARPLRVYRVRMPGQAEARRPAPEASEPEPAPAPRVFAFGECELDEGLYALRRRGETVKVEPKVFDVLRYLVRERERVVTKAELLERLWPGEHVSQSVLPRTVHAVREAIGERGWIQTVHGRGYRFVGPVEEREAPSRAPSADAAAVAEGEAAELFVGREAVMAELRGALESALGGRGRVVLLLGEPGIGKTRTAEQIAAEAGRHGARVLWGRCHEGEGAPAFWPWVQLLRACVGDVDPATLGEQMGAGAVDVALLVPELREKLLGLGEPPQLPSDQARFRLFDSVGGFLRAAARARPAALILDDLHWADAPSLLLLQFLAREMGDTPVLILATCRDLEVPLDHPLSQALGELSRQAGVRRIELKGLDEAEVARFLASILGWEPDPELVEAVYQRTEGNPLFLRETMSLLLAGWRPGEALREAIPLVIPRGVRDVIGRRMAGLSETCRDALAVASVLGREFGLPLLESLAGLSREALLAALDDAVGERFVAEVRGAVGRYAFVHALIRDTLHESLPTHRRAFLHREAGEALEKLAAGSPELYLSELAHHFYAAAPTGTADAAIRYGVRAAARATRLLAYEEAAAHHGRALEMVDLQIPPDERQRLDLLLALGESQLLAGQYTRSRETFERAVGLSRSLGGPEDLARAALAYSRGSGGPMPDEPVRLVLEEALGAVGEVDSPLRARLLARLSSTPSYSIEKRRALAERALESARRTRDPETLSYVLGTWPYDLCEPLRLHENLALAAEALELGESFGHNETVLAARNVRRVAFLTLGDAAAAARETEAYSRRAEELRVPINLWYASTQRVCLAILRGQFDLAEERIRQNLAFAQRAQNPYAVPSFLVQTYWLLRERGRLGELADKLDLVRLETEYGWAGPNLPIILSICLTEFGQASEARRVFETLACNDFVEIPRDHDWLWALADLAHVCAFLDDARSAEPLYELLEPHRELHVVYESAGAYVGPVAHHLGVLASVLRDWDRAAQHFEKATESCERIGSPPYGARAKAAHARALLARGSKGDALRARELLQDSLATARELGMSGLERDCSAALVALEAGASPRSQTPRAPRSRSRT